MNYKCELRIPPNAWTQKILKWTVQVAILQYYNLVVSFGQTTSLVGNICLAVMHSLGQSQKFVKSLDVCKVKAVVLEEQQFRSPLCFHMWIAVSRHQKVRPRSKEVWNSGSRTAHVSPGRRFGHPNPFRIRGDKVVPGHLWVGERLSQSFGATWFSYGFIILECSESCWFLASIFSERFCIMGSTY